MAGWSPTETAPDDLVVVGRIVGVYGVKGWVRVRSFTEPAENLFRYRPWWILEGDDWRRFDVDGQREHGGALVAHVAGIDDRDRAGALCRRDISVARRQFAVLTAGEHYWSDLIGLSVYSIAGGGRVPLGTVAALMETGANDVLVVREQATGRSRERLIPFIDPVLQRIDLAARELEVDWDPAF